MSHALRMAMAITIAMVMSACGTFAQYRQETATIVKVVPVLISTDNAYSQGVIDLVEYEKLQRQDSPGCTSRVQGRGHLTTIECTDHDKYFVNAVQITYRTSNQQYLQATYKADRHFVVGQQVVISVFNDLVLK
jgi:hypothetical protein